MNLDELIERLKDLRDEHGGDTEVRLMTQQNWPFENAVHGVTTADEIAIAEQDDEDPTPTADAEKVVYIVEGTQLKYGSKAAWDACE